VHGENKPAENSKLGNLLNPKFSLSRAAIQLANGEEIPIIDAARLFITINSDSFPFHGDIEGFDGSTSLSRRLICRFPSGLDIVISADGDVYIIGFTDSQLTEALEIFSTMKITPIATSDPQVAMLPELGDPSDVLEVVCRYIEVEGNPRILLPWEDSFGSFIENSEEIDLDELDCTKKDFNSVLALAECLEQGIEWPHVEIGSYKDFLPSSSAYQKLEKLYDSFDPKRWIVLAEECCSTCAASTIKSRIDESNGALAEATPVFATWGQGSAYSYRADGSINVAASVWAEDTKYMSEAAKLATSCGLKAEIGDFLSLT